MAQVILGGVGQAIGGGIGRSLGAALGGVADRSLIGALSPARQVGPRLETLKIQSTAEGAPMACVFGRARVTGQVIWAARFLEQRNRSGGGKGGPRTVDYGYSLSFAVALCEGPIDGIGRVWADGKPMDQTGVAMRVYRGSEDQTPDPLIEAVEGAAPAYRGTAYVVFEDLPLGPYGDRMPQLSFEVFRRPEADGLETMLEGICLIPGAGEFVLATQAVMRREGLTRTRSENIHLGDGRTDVIASLDQLAAQLPNLKRVSLVIGWFGTDLRAGHCVVRPGVERRNKPTEPLTWSVAGLGREDAHLISEADGRPSYGGTPSDESVRQAVAALKARGWAVTLYPFVFMDCEGYPWRGRVKGADGPGAAAEVAAVFGTADGWGLRRLALHYAGLAAETGCDGLLIGSEMRGLTGTRDAAGGYPAVQQYRALAAECRAVVGPEVALSYAADWSEYSGHRPDDGSGDVVFHLDPLWADEAIDYVGIDWYPPLGDWRGGDGGRDAEAFAGPDDPLYLATQVAGGEGFDWFYADEADRAAQVRTAIVDTAHGEDWVFRPKALKGWWGNVHHDRPGGVRAAVPTAWVPGMKPIRLTEFGCGAVDRGGNAPNLFQDPKSAESSLPPFSTGARDDGMQRRALEAVLKHFATGPNNPLSSVYGGPMLAGADAWCWDARPYPAFPALGDVWADASAWRAGHWLNGRVGGEGRALLAAILRRGGLEADGFEVGEPVGKVSGYVIDRPMRTRDALEPLLGAFDMVGAERDGRVALVGVEAAGATVALEAMALREETSGPVRERVLEARPETARVRFIDDGADYQTGAVVARAETATGGGGVDVDLPIVCGTALGAAMARRMLAAHGADRVTLALGPLEALRLEPGDTVAVEGETGAWRVECVTLDETPSARLARRSVGVVGPDNAPTQLSEGAEPPGVPFARILDLPGLPGAETDGRPVVIAAGDPWRPMAVHVGETSEGLMQRGTVDMPATVGRLVGDLRAGPVDRWDEVNTLVVALEGTAPTSASDGAALGQANLLAVESVTGWEILSFREATLVSTGVWRLSGLLRGRQGTEVEAEQGAAVGATVVVLDGRAGRLELDPAERRLDRRARIGPIGSAPGGAGFAEVPFRFEGVVDRPWRPAALRVVPEAGGLGVSWLPRVRVGGDRWDIEAAEVDVRRFRLRVLDGDVERRVFEVEGLSAVYAGADLAADFPGGPGEGARVAVAQYGVDWGWGREAVCRLAA
ncbi:glycoside hydrolase/phage tail family protein [Brevundimonas sp. AJA228-03]|uniref:baseplate multidomain protein megatron n=1 Tax=Brevundimonas sp. AJA228-03 TaxID=2752515 RepID=UPI001ADF0BB5|nr:glycoside hydrolase/phage tail family protein [Brevundimonas sp. AJA228-03]QTN19158.1 glycoside hydrolase/phage tail family protein [Brevundimonas sp. AJA228-03]